MKKIVLISLIFVSIIACSRKESETSSPSQDDSTRRELEEAVANRDSLLSLVNQIAANLDQIKSLQNILTAPGLENADARAKISADIAAIQQTLEQRQEQLRKLEARLANSNRNNENLRQTIDNLRSQIDSQAEEIKRLNTIIAHANDSIEQLSGKVSDLSNTIADVTNERDAAVNRSNLLEGELNTCYFVAASSKELKEHNILKSGFLKKTQLMPDDFDRKFFTVANKQTLTNINLYSKKAKVLTNQPATSYEIVDENGQKVLHILNKESFWSISNFLVIEID